MDVTKLFNEETRDLMSKYAIAMGVTPEELYGAFLGAMQPLINKSIQIGDRDIKNDVNVVVVDTSGNAGKCARRLQGIHNQLLDPQEAKRLVEEDSKRVECDPVTGKQRANLDENTTNGLFVLKAEDVYGALQNKTPLGHNYTFIGNAPGTFKVQPRNSEKQQEEDAKVIQEMEAVFAGIFRALLAARQTQFRLSPDAVKFIEETCSTTN